MKYTKNDSIDYWYHCSSENLGKEVVLIPTTNEESEHRADYEPDGARICVSKSIAGALVAKDYSSGNYIFVYKTKRRVRARRTYRIPDSWVTEERWILKKIKFELLFKINTKHILDISEFVCLRNNINYPYDFVYGDSNCCNVQNEIKKSIKEALENKKSYKNISFSFYMKAKELAKNVH